MKLVKRNVIIFSLLSCFSSVVLAGHAEVDKIKISKILIDKKALEKNIEIELKKAMDESLRDMFIKDNFMRKEEVRNILAMSVNGKKKINCKNI